MSATHPFAGGVRKRPTLKHSPVIWEAMLGTVYAASPSGEVRYFDYRWDEARAFAEIDPAVDDLRVARKRDYPRPYGVSFYGGSKEPYANQLCLWAVRR